MDNILILGQHTQGMIAACMLAKTDRRLQVIAFPDDSAYTEFFEGSKIGPVTHLPLALPKYLLKHLELEKFGLEEIEAQDNPFEKLPFYNGLKKLCRMFVDLNGQMPPYREKAWRDTWSTFEIGRILSEYDADVQALFAKSATLSLIELLEASNLNEVEQAEITALCLLGSRTNLNGKGTAAAILPAMMAYEREDSVILQGTIHSLSRALHDCAQSNGVEFIEGKYIRTITTHGEKISSVICDDESELKADYYIFDHDPVSLFQNFLKDFKPLPSFKNRVVPPQNIKEAVQIRVVIDDVIALPNYVAPNLDYIAKARQDFQTDGGSQNPILSIINVSEKYPQMGINGQSVLSVIAQYFEHDLDNDEAILMAVKNALKLQIPDFDISKIVNASLFPVSSQFGQPTFNSAMPLLQLLKIFSGYHAIAYDFPIENAVVAGYGGGTAAHYHTYDGGERVANLLQSFE